MASPRFDHLPQRLVGAPDDPIRSREVVPGCRAWPLGGRAVPVAIGFRARTLGLSLLDRGDAGPGLLIPRCAAVHTFGMRFALDVYFLGADDEVLSVRPAVPPRRFVAHRGAAAVLEIPA